MIMTVAGEATNQERGGLRPMDATRDLGAIADLIAVAFADELDARGQAALREMRWMARLTPLVWWWSQVDPSFQDAFSGFVWEEPSPEAASSRSSEQIVGNVSLNRAPGNRQRWIICNVVVLQEFQGQGIARRMMQAAIDEAREIGAVGVLLQVHRDNPRALGLYSRMGFHEVSGETTLRLDAVSSVAVLDAPGYEIRRGHPVDGQTVYELARHAIPAAQQWIRPVRAQEYKPDWLIRLGQWISDLVAGRHSYRLTARKDNQLVAAMTVTTAGRRGEHSLALLVDPAHQGKVEAALISRALHILASAPSKPVGITANVGNEATLRVLRDYGFKEQRTLLTMRKDFT
jgi:ribosomal protein S18 acetylase RimI-like enzyme